MINIGSEFAKWEPYIIEEDGEILRSKIDGEKFRSYEYELKRRGEHDLIPGTTSSVNDCTLALKTAESAAKKFHADDSIIWQGKTYSIIAIQEVRSTLRLNGREYIIYLKR